MALNHTAYYTDIHIISPISKGIFIMPTDTTTTELNGKNPYSNDRSWDNEVASTNSIQFPNKDWNDVAHKILTASYTSSGAGAYNQIMPNFFSGLDRYGTAIVPVNTMNVGYTFITRPRLNLTTGNIRHNPILATLDSHQPNDVSFMIRMLLDTRLSKGEFIKVNGRARREPNINIITEAVRSSQLVDAKNPFFTPLCNAIKGISGFPDINLQEETCMPDFFSGDFTYIKGWDQNNRTQELSLEFRDIQGSVILAILYYWCLYMALQARGVVMAYQDDIWLQRLNYTVSIYRFILDTSRSRILWWAKATGCFPKSAPVGSIFNFDQGEVTVTSGTNFSIPFVANDIKYNDPYILLDFNKLVQNYNPSVDLAKLSKAASENRNYTTSRIASNNFFGIPYIDISSGRMYLNWLDISDKRAPDASSLGIN